jgi:hypothetical protein
MLAFEKTNTAYAWKVRWVILGMILLGIISLNITPVDVILNLQNGNNIFDRQQNTCTMLNIFGIPCPLCGMSRGFHEIWKLNFAGGIHYNPFSVVFYPLVFTSISVIFIASIFNYRLRIVNFRIFWWGIFVLFIIVWVANIMWGHH